MCFLTAWVLIVAGLSVTLKAYQINDHFLVTVKTGDGIDAETGSNVVVVFEDNNRRMTQPFPINRLFRGHLEQRGIDQHRVPIPEGFGTIMTLKFSRFDKHVEFPDWYSEFIFVDDPRINHRFYFPIDRWIESNLVYEFENYATCLPQFDMNNNIRELNLQNKRKDYIFKYNTGPATVIRPREEFFNDDYNFQLSKMQTVFFTSTFATGLLEWNIFNDINVIYREEFYLPESIHFWKEDSWFGAQRVQGLLPNIIELCHKIPDKLGVTEEVVRGLLEHYTLHQALKNNKIFNTDLEILDGVEYRYNIDHSAPIALFYLNMRNQLMPIAIQLRQRKGPSNPVYTPKDQLNTWLLAKMYYNNAEAQFHQALSHFGYTHAFLDGIATSMNRQLSPSHPIYKLLRPHFKDVISINKFADITILKDGAMLDSWSMLLKETPHITFKRAIGSVESDATARGVWDKQVLPYYPFRDDAMALYNIIKKYVTTIITHYYDTTSSVSSDWELQNWHTELALPRAQGGVGIPDLPGTRGFHDIGEVIDVVTMFITQSAVGHTAVNFPQYDMYGYLPNYPSMIMEGPPAQKREYTEADIMRMLPSRRDILSVMRYTKILSWQGANELSDFEKRYLYDPLSLKANVELKEDLKEVKNRNRHRLYPYKYLDPNYVPNGLSI
ncbi:unnamed protein product, partial [Meganyctiphanes norvegica]